MDLLRPQLPPGTARKILSDRGALERHQVALLGVRGFYLAAGKPGVNDVGLYDDAIFLSTPVACTGFNANTDPSREFPGVANLATGLWLYKVGIHGLSKPKDEQYTALVQAAEVVVNRHDSKTEKGFFGINIHRGGINTTSSLGCQTILRAQWPEFITTVQAALKDNGERLIPYLLITHDELTAVLSAVQPVATAPTA